MRKLKIASNAATDAAQDERARAAAAHRARLRRDALKAERQRRRRLEPCGIPDRPLRGWDVETLDVMVVDRDGVHRRALVAVRTDASTGLVLDTRCVLR